MSQAYGAQGKEGVARLASAERYLAGGAEVQAIAAADDVMIIEVP